MEGEWNGRKLITCSVKTHSDGSTERTCQKALLAVCAKGTVHLYMSPHSLSNFWRELSVKIYVQITPR